MPNDFNQHIINEFRANGGRVGGPFEGSRLLLLTTVGARSGAQHTVPLGYLPDGGERVLVIASGGGAPKHPDWFHNLVASPRVQVEDGVFTYDAHAVVLEPPDRDVAFTRAVQADPGWSDDQSQAGHLLPVVALHEIPGPPNINAKSAGAALQVIHDAFRRELALIRKEVADIGPGLGAQLRVTCLTVCRGLDHHHTGEDTGLFPFLAERHPELATTVDRLRREHETIAAFLTDLQQIVSADGADPVRVRTEVERLTDELESHLTYEEEQLIPILDTIAV